MCFMLEIKSTVVSLVNDYFYFKILPARLLIVDLGSSETNFGSTSAHHLIPLGIIT